MFTKPSLCIDELLLARYLLALLRVVFVPHRGVCVVRDARAATQRTGLVRMRGEGVRLKLDVWRRFVEVHVPAGDCVDTAGNEVLGEPTH